MGSEHECKTSEGVRLSQISYRLGAPEPGTFKGAYGARDLCRTNSKSKTSAGADIEQNLQRQDKADNLG